MWMGTSLTVGTSVNFRLAQAFPGTCFVWCHSVRTVTGGPLEIVRNFQGHEEESGVVRCDTTPNRSASVRRAHPKCRLPLIKWRVLDQHARARVAVVTQVMDAF